MISSKDRFGEAYFRHRARFPTAVFKGRDLSFLKFPFWDRCIRKRKGHGRLLDVGCAEGALLRWAGRRSYQGYGVDVSLPALRIANRRNNKSEIIAGDVTSLPFKAEHFDAVTCFDVLEHIEDPLAGLRQVGACLKRDGILVISVPNLDSCGLKWKGREWFGFRDTTHVSLLRESEWNDLLREAGFEAIDSFNDTLWDSPYFRHIPTLIQHAAFKPLLLVFYWTPIRVPRRLGENLYIVARKVGER